MSPPRVPPGARRPPGLALGHRGAAGEIEVAIRAALEAVLPDPERSFYVDRLNERFGDGTVVDGVQTPLVRAQPALAGGAAAIVTSFRVQGEEGRLYVRQWWHGLELDGVANPTRAQLTTAWQATRTTLAINGSPVPYLADLQGQRTDPLAPADVAIKVVGGKEFQIKMAIDGAYAGPDILCNAAFRGHAA